MRTQFLRRGIVAAGSVCLLLGAAANCAWADSVTNGGFETGTLSGWTVTTGLNNLGGFSVTDPNANISAGGVNTTVITSAGTDTYASALPKVHDGSHAVRINDTTANYNVNGIHQTFASASNDESLTFAWAAVMQNPGHPFDEQPFVRVSLWDVTKSNQLVYDQLIYSNIAGTSWQNGNGVLYTNWQDFNINISAFAGDTLKLQFLAAGCELGGHFGYAYVDGVSTTTAALVQTQLGDNAAAPLPSTAVAGMGLLGCAAGAQFIRRRKLVVA